MRIYRIRKFPAKLILLLLIIIVALNPRILPGLKNFAFDILARPFKALSGMRTRFAEARYLSEENLLLKQRLAGLSVALARMKELALENERLRSLLDFKKSTPYKTIAARVIARDSTDWRRAIIISKGATHGIKTAMPCATTKGLIGSVVEVGPTSSKVMLINDPNSRVGVIVEPSRESGVLTGSLEGLSKVIYLSLDAKIEKGNGVLTAGFSHLFPKGLAVGEVTEVGVERTGLYKYAVVDPFEDMNKIEEVICIAADR